MLFTFYLAIAVYLISRTSFIKRSGLTPKLIIALFLLKVLAGMAVGWVSQKFYPGNDYWGLHSLALDEYKLMMSDPHEFFTNIFRSPYKDGYTGFFNSVGSYWNDLRDNIVIKIMTLCDIFSRSNYYINSLFFDVFGFLGHIALYRVFSDIYQDKKWPVLIGCFLLPSTLYFSSGMGRDLVVFTVLGLFCYALHFSLQQKFTTKRLMVIVFSVIVMLLIRNFVAIAFVPVSIAYILCSKRKVNPLVAFFSTYAVMLLLILVLQVLMPSFQPLKIISQKQSDFLDLPVANSQLQLNVLEPNLKSFMINLPQAINHGFLRPYLLEGHGKFALPLAIELLFYELLFLFIVFKYRFKLSSGHPFILFAIFFTVSMFIITGYIIPNTSSIVRYKSIYLPLIITPMLCGFFVSKPKNP
ncbi:MAG: hypothetical protein QM737_17665 [Ferruginibacter sp.]